MQTEFNKTKRNNYYYCNTNIFNIFDHFFYLSIAKDEFGESTHLNLK